MHLFSLAEAAYKLGLVFGKFEWVAGLTLILLSLFISTLHLRSKVATLPDFLELRFESGCCNVLSLGLPSAKLLLTYLVIIRK